MFKHRGKEKIKVQFDIMLKKVTQLDKSLNGSTVFVEWKRKGGTQASGMTKRSLVAKNEATWNESFSVSATIFKDPKSDTFDPKKLYLTLKEVSFVLEHLRNRCATFGVNAEQTLRT